MQQPSGTIVYTDQLGEADILSIKDSFKKKYFVGQLQSNKPVKLVLSKAEHRYVDSVITLLPKLYWQNSLFNNSERIPKDSIWARIDKQHKESADRIVNAKSDSSRNQAISKWIEASNTFQFSVPIFLRNRSIFFFYFKRLCGSQCGTSDLSVYRLENGVYKKWFLIDGGEY